MSVESATAFIAKLQRDAAFAQSVSGAVSKSDRLRIVTEAGFSFSKADLDAASGSLSPEELADIVGGKLAVPTLSPKAPGSIGGLGLKCDTFETTSECLC
ncbi:MAG: Nif11 domain [Pseudomonadota bacterium]|jgi:predicted ribosomally synthesized peptide with nif11-like leader